MEQNNSTPKFSVIVPVYNTEKYLDEAVQSVLAQTESSFELLLIDDGSTDGSVAICDKWAQQDNRIHAIHQSNKGQIAARECGIKHACGEYVVFLDSDDLLDINTLECLSNEIDDNQPDCLVYGFQLFDDNKYGKVYCDETKRIITNANDFYQIIISDSSYNSLCRKSFRKAIINNYDYSKSYGLRFGEDLVQSVYILQNCHKVIFLNKVLYYYRSVLSSVTHRKIYDWGSRYKAREVVLSLLLNNAEIKTDTLTIFKKVSTKKYAALIVEILSSSVSYRDKVGILRKLKKEKWNQDYIAKDIAWQSLSTKEKSILLLFEKGKIIILVLLWTIRIKINGFLNHNISRML